MDVKKYTILHEYEDRVHPEQATRYVFEHPPYSSNLASSDFHLFLELKNKLSEMRFQSNEEVESRCRSFFRKLDPEFYARGTSELVSQYNKCLNINGNYVEKS